MNIFCIIFIIGFTIQRDFTVISKNETINFRQLFDLINGSRALNDSNKIFPYVSDRETRKIEMIKLVNKILNT